MQSTNSTQTLKILTLNLAMLPMKNVNRQGRMQYFCENILCKYDIVCTQEFFSSEPFYKTKAQTIAWYKAIGYYVSECPGTWKGGDYSAGSIANIASNLIKSSYKAIADNTNAAAIISDQKPGDSGLLIFSKYPIIET